MLEREPKRWSDVIGTDVNVSTWTFTLRAKGTGEDLKKMVRAIGEEELNLN